MEIRINIVDLHNVSFLKQMWAVCSFARKQPKIEAFLLYLSY